MGFVADVDLFARRDESSVQIYTVKNLANGAPSTKTRAMPLSTLR
jgi:hypothetical protein